MAGRTPNTLLTLLRASGSTFRQPTAQNTTTRALSQLSHRSPSPSRPSSAHNSPILSSTTQWTHFSTPYSHSSIRTFTRSSALAFPSSSHNTSSSSNAAQDIDSIIEKIQDLYGTARDEFEMAYEETEKNTTYAEEDRAAAREELDALLEFYKGVIEGEDRGVAEEVKNRVGGRIRELEQAVLSMEDDVANGDH